MSKAHVFHIPFLSPRKPEESLALPEIMAALPGEYCAWAPDGNVKASPGLCDLIGIESVTHLADIQWRLAEGDGAALGEAFHRLEDGGSGFSMVLRSQGGRKTFKMTGNRSAVGVSALWIEDITGEARSKEDKAEEAPKDDAFLERIYALHALPHPAWIRDVRHNIIWCNALYAEALKSTPEEVVAEQKEFALSTRKKKEQKKAIIGKALAEQAIQKSKLQVTKTHIIVGGKRLLMKISEAPLEESGMTLGLAEDITGQEDMEQKLGLYQSANEVLLEQLTTAIGIYDSNMQLDFFNSAFAQLWGLEDQWLNSKPKLTELMEKLRETRRLPEQADFRRFKDSWVNMFTGLIEPHEEMLHLPDGSTLRMLAVPSPSGGLMMNFEDVSSRLELESSYNTLIAVQKETLDNLAEAVAVFGGDGRLKLWNPAYGRLWNLNPENLEGEPHITTLVEKVKALFEEEDWQEQKGELIALGLDRVMHEGRHELKNGILIDYSTVPLPDGGVLITYSNVTDSVRVENALREKNKALETAEQLKIDFLANVSYQLRTPLNAIMGFNEILDQEYFGPLNSRQKEYTNDTKLASMRLLNLINDILDLSTIEAGYLSLNTEEVGVKDMLQNLADLVMDWARKENIELMLTCPKTIGKIVMDEQRIKQALMNLVRNAIAHTPGGGKIEIKAKKKKENIEFSVSDTGTGIDERDKIRILQPFERAQTGTKEKSKDQSGAGLGLSLVNNIVALHGGDMALSSEKGKGTTVSFTIPLEMKNPPKKKKIMPSF